MIETERLILRAWREADAAPFHAMGQDVEVMRFIGPLLTEADAAAMTARQNGILAVHGYCFWALETKDDGAFIGFCGVKPGVAGSPIEGQAEIGWRLARDRWGQGYALESAQAALSWMWIATPEPLVAAITVTDNARSRALMERLGMTRFPAEDFDHPVLPAGDPLRRHVVYRIQRPVGL